MINGKTLSRLIDSIYQSAITGDWQSSINAIRKYTNSNKIFFVIRDLKTGEPITVEFLASFDYNPDILLHYADVMDEDPWYQLSQLGLEGDVMHLSKLLPVESFKDSNIYKTIFKPMHSYYCLGVVLARNSQYEATFAINRGELSTEYTERDKTLIELLTPHLTRAIKLFINFKTYRNLISIAEITSRNETKAMFLCDENATILKVNSLGNELISSNPCISNIDNKLVITERCINDRIRKIIAENALFSAENITCRQVVILEGGDEKLLLEVMPLVQRYFYSGDYINCVVVTITAENQINWELVTSVYQLTKREIDISQLIYAKRRVADIASSLCLSENTIRTHIQNIYAKLQVKTQTEFIVNLNLFS